MKTALALLAAVVLQSASPSALAQQEPRDIRSFVQSAYVEGIPYDEVMRYDATAATAALLEMLADPNEQPHWRRIVFTLGMLGQDQAVEPLIRFLEQDAGMKLSNWHYRAKVAVPMALGYLVNRSRNATALAYLQAGVRPAAWSGRRLKWASPVHESPEGRDQQLSRMAIIGLALSAHPDAAQTLYALRGAAPTEADRQFRARVGPMIDEALAAHDTIRRQGLVQYDAARRRR